MKKLIIAVLVLVLGFAASAETSYFGKYNGLDQYVVENANLGKYIYTAYKDSNPWGEKGTVALYKKYYKPVSVYMNNTDLDSEVATITKKYGATVTTYQNMFCVNVYSNGRFSTIFFGL